MQFILDNIGYVIVGILALVVMSSTESEEYKQNYADFDETAWANSKENPNSPNYTGI